MSQQNWQESNQFSLYSDTVCSCATVRRGNVRRFSLFSPFLGVKTYLCLRRIAERNIFQFRTAEFSELYTHTQGERFSQATTHIPMHCQTSTDQRNHQNLAEKILGGSCNSSTFYLWMIDTSCCLTCIRTSALTNLGFELRMALLLVCVVLLYTIIQR